MRASSSGDLSVCAVAVAASRSSSAKERKDLSFIENPTKSETLLTQVTLVFTRKNWLQQEPAECNQTTDFKSSRVWTFAIESDIINTERHKIRNTKLNFTRHNQPL